MTPAPAPGPVIVVSAHVVAGSGGLATSTFVLERRGHPVRGVPAMIASRAFDGGADHRIVPDAEAFDRLLDDMPAAPGFAGIAGMIIGRLADAGQIAAAARLAGALKHANPAALILLDPAPQDAGSAEVLRNRLLPLADIVTVSLAGLELLAGTSPATPGAATAAARSLACPMVVVTSAPAMMARSRAILAVTASDAAQAEHPELPGTYPGSGDLFAALYLSFRLAGHDASKALERAATATFDMVARAARGGSSDLPLAAEHDVLVHSMAHIQLRRLATPVRPPRPPARPALAAGDATEARPDARIVAGVDGCRTGWIVCRIAASGPILPHISVVPRFADLLTQDPPAEAIAIDMPIGLPDRIGAGGRGPERAVRPMLGARQSSVFSIPSRVAVYAGDGLDDRAGYAATCAAALATSDPPRKVSKQGFALFPKIRELDALLSPDLCQSVIESHPEVAFTVLNDGQPMELPKKIKGSVNPAGIDERRALLVRLGFPSDALARPPRGAGLDDLIDACVLALVARRRLNGEAVPFPNPPGRDARGLTVAIWA